MYHKYHTEEHALTLVSGSSKYCDHPRHDWIVLPFVCLDDNSGVVQSKYFSCLYEEVIECPQYK